MSIINTIEKTIVLLAIILEELKNNDMGRKRIKELPKNLYEDDGYYRYRNPRTKNSYKLGKDREIAIRDALQLNAMLEPISERVREILYESDKKNQSISKFLEHFEADILPNGKLTQSTISDYK
jgi:enterobacteria phage integrase